MTTTLQPVAASNSTLECVPLPAGTSAVRDASFAALCSALMPSSIPSGATDPTSTQANGSSEQRPEGEPGRPSPRVLPDDKQSDTTPPFHPFLPGLLIAMPFCASVAPSQPAGDRLPQGYDTNPTHARPILAEADLALAASSTDLVHSAELASRAASTAGRGETAEEATSWTRSRADFVAGSDKLTSPFGESWVAAADQSPADALSAKSLQPSSAPSDAGKRDAEVAQCLPEFAVPRSEREIVSTDTGQEHTIAQAQRMDDSSPLWSAALDPPPSTPGVIDVAPTQISGESPERIASAPARASDLPTALAEKQNNSKLEEQEPRLAHGNWGPKQEPLADAPMRPEGVRILRTVPTYENVANPRAPGPEAAVTLPPAAPLTQRDDGATCFENSTGETSSTATPAVASGEGMSGKPSRASRDEDDSSTTPAGRSSPATTPAAVAGISSTMIVAPPAAEQAAMTDASIHQNHATSNNPGHYAFAPESSAARTTPSEVAARSGLTGLEMARVIAKVGHSEMRIGLSTSAFGSVEVHTVVHADEVGVVIGSERGDLPGLIRSELPAISHNLQQQDVRLNQVNFQQQGFGFSANSQSGGHSQPRSFAAKGNFESVAVSQGATAESSPLMEPLGRPGTGLSILA